MSLCNSQLSHIRLDIHCPGTGAKCNLQLQNCNKPPGSPVEIIVIQIVSISHHFFLLPLGQHQLLSCYIADEHLIH